MVVPERIGLRELRQHASRCVDLVEQGAAIEVTKRGRTVARLVPARGDGDVDELLASGELQPPEHPGDLLSARPAPPVSSGASVSDELRRMRDAERW